MKPKELFMFFVGLVFCVLVFSNIYASQSISSVYFDLTKGKRNAVVRFLKRIKNLSFFQRELEKAKLEFGKEIEEEVFSEEKRIKEKIKKLEKALDKNPKARDVLYALSALYRTLGKKDKADFYFQKAKSVDPALEF